MKLLERVDWQCLGGATTTRRSTQMIYEMVQNFHTISRI